MVSRPAAKEGGASGAGGAKEANEANSRTAFITITYKHDTEYFENTSDFLRQPLAYPAGSLVF